MKLIVFLGIFSIFFTINSYAQDKEVICADSNCVPNFQPEEQFEKVYYSSIEVGDENQDFIFVDSERNSSPRTLRMSINQNDNYTPVEATINLSPKTDEFDAGNLVLLTDFLKSLNLNLDGYQGSFGKPASQVCAENYTNGKYGAIAREEFNAKRIANNSLPTNRCIYSDVDYLQKNEFECEEGYQEIPSDNPTITVRRLKGKTKCLGVGFQDLCLSKSVEVTCTWRLKYLDPPELSGQFSNNPSEQEVKTFIMPEKEFLEKRARGLVPYLCNKLTKREEDPEPIEKMVNGGFYRDADGWSLTNNAKWVNSKAKLDDGPVINMKYPIRPGDGLRMRVYSRHRYLHKDISVPNIDYTGRGSLSTLTGLYSRFTTRFTGYIRPKFSETYNFYAYSDDGVRVWINGKLIIDRWWRQSPNWGSPGRIFLEANKLYSIRVDHYEHKGREAIALDWSSRSQGRQRVPQSALYSSFQKDFLALNGYWTDEIALNLTTHYNNTSVIDLNYEFLTLDSNRVSCRQRGRQLLCKFYMPANETATNKLLSNVLRVKIWDQNGNSNIYDIQLRYTIYNTNLHTISYLLISGGYCNGGMSESSIPAVVLYGYDNYTDWIYRRNLKYCYKGSCSTSGWDAAIKPKYPQFTATYGYDYILEQGCSNRYSYGGFYGSRSFYTQYWPRYAANVKGRWFEGYVSIARETMPTVEKIVSTEEDKEYRLTATYFEPSEERSRSQLKLTIRDDVSNVVLSERTLPAVYNGDTEFIDFTFKTSSFRTKFTFEAIEADPENYSSSVYLDNVSLKEISLNAGPSIPPTDPLTANVQGEQGNGYYALYQDPTYERTSPGFDGQNVELIEGSNWELQYTGINQNCPIFYDKIATEYLASHIGYDENDDQCDDVILDQDPEGVLAWSNIGFERNIDFGTETLACNTTSCPVSSTVQSLEKSLDFISTTSGINGTNQGRGIIMSYDVENISSSARVGVAGKAGANDLPVIESPKSCVKIQDFNTEGPDSEYAISPVVDFRLYDWQALKVLESQDLGVNPEDNGNRVYIYKKMDSSARYFLGKEML